MSEKDITIDETIGFIQGLANRDVRSGKRVVERFVLLEPRQVKLLRGARKAISAMSSLPSVSDQRTREIKDCFETINGLVEFCCDGDVVKAEPSIVIWGDEFEVLHRSTGYLVEYKIRQASEADKEKHNAKRGKYKGKT